MTDEQNQEGKTTEKLSLNEEKGLMKFMVSSQIPESLSDKNIPKRDMISRTQSTPDSQQASDSSDD